MGKLLIRNLDDAVIEKLRQRAVAKGNSMEEEARQTLARAVGVDLEAWLADVEAFAASLGESEGPTSEVLVRELREERARYLHDRGSGKK